MDINKVLVYGTLKIGFYNNYLLDQVDAKLLKKDIKLENFQMRSFGSFPCVRECKDNFIIGDVYEVDKYGIIVLDSLEIPYGYCREIVNVFMDNINVKCYIYSYLNEKIFNLLPLIENGVWQ